MSTEAFQIILQINPGLAYYLVAFDQVKSILFESRISTDQAKVCQSTFEYLQQQQASIQQEPRALYLQFRVWWLSQCRTSLFSQEDRQTLPFNQENWQQCYRFVTELRAMGEFRDDLKLLYLEGLAHFHLNRVEACIALFREMETESLIIGRRRIHRSYLASMTSGQPRRFIGEVESRHAKSNEAGFVYIPELQHSIKFIPQQFGKPEIQRGETLGEFHIGFNFLGPIADPINYYVERAERSKLTSPSI